MKHKNFNVCKGEILQILLTFVLIALFSYLLETANERERRQ